MRYGYLAAALLFVVTGCGSKGATGTATPSHTGVISTVAPTARATPRPTPTVVIGHAYAAFVRSLCQAFSSKNGAAASSMLPYYAYNSGVRYGYFGDGEGQTGDPSVLRGWVASGHVRCHSITPDDSGHGSVLTSGWTLPRGTWSLIELDIFNGHWKINDFTYGDEATLRRAMQTGGTIVRFAGARG